MWGFMCGERVYMPSSCYVLYGGFLIYQRKRCEEDFLFCRAQPTFVFILAYLLTTPTRRTSTREKRACRPKESESPVHEDTRFRH